MRMQNLGAGCERRERERARIHGHGHKCETKAADTQDFSQAARHEQPRITKKAHPQSDWCAVVDGLTNKKNRGSTKYNPEIKSHCKSASKCIYSFVGVYACSHPRWARVQDCKKMKQKDLKCFDSTLNSKKTTGMISNNNKVRSQFSFVEYPV
jgi:hypothetical protein